ncbi:HTH_Tnp_Tc3_2 domain-containing protein [Trichonephila clavipes]|nr:HTH_Tnp_Tc3_2 domain-containing protein [Trichonephila clavipes]
MMPRVRSMNAYQHFSDFDKSRIVVYRDRGLSHRIIATLIVRDVMTVSRILIRWVQDGNTKRRTVSQPAITSSCENRHVIRRALMDHAATSRALSQELGSFGRQQMFARTFRRRLHQHGLSARRPWLRLHLTLHHRQEYLQWFCLQSQDVHIRVWWHHGGRTLAAYIRHRHTGPSPGVMLCDILRFSRIMHDCMMPVLYGPSFIQTMLGCCPGLYVHQISREQMVNGCRATGSSKYGTHYG